MAWMRLVPVVLLLPAVLWAADEPREIPNLSDVKAAIVKYHDSGRWDNQLAAVGRQAEAWIVRRSKKGGKLALVLDIDETALANWPIEKKTDFGYIPSMYSEWEKAGKAPANPAVLRLFRTALAQKVAVFFITGRHESSRDGTARNLEAVGYKGYAALTLKPDDLHVDSAITYKAAERAKIQSQGYRIIANVGDQWSDLKGGYSEKVFKLPNPMYFIE